MNFAKYYALLLTLSFCCQSAAEQLYAKGIIRVSCLLQNTGELHSPPRIYQFDLADNRGFYSVITKMSPVFRYEFRFTPDYFPAPHRFLYWQENDNTLGRPSDNFNFSLETDQKEALMLFYSRYRYDIKMGELQMTRRGFSNWDKGEAGKIYYHQISERWKCNKIN